ncbi:MAG: insulinase family protein, partial [Candidatus Omnitrophica bacterium]|nr:insulinase family protein [Candidatus Omnitrophota bacterium]
FFSLAKKYFSFLKPGERLSFRKAEFRQKGVQTNFLGKDTEQTHLSLGVHGLHRQHKDRYALALLHIILGGNMSSRLFEEVREKRGLAYEISTHLKKFQDTGAFVISAGVEHKKAKEAIKVVMQELRKIKKTPVSKSEFRRAKEYFTGQFLLSLEETMDHMLWLGENVTMLEKIYTPQEVLREVKRTKIEDIQRLANFLFKTDDLNLALIGPISEKDKKEIENNLVV